MIFESIASRRRAQSRPLICEARGTALLLSLLAVACGEDAREEDAGAEPVDDAAVGDAAIDEDGAADAQVAADAAADGGSGLDAARCDASSADDATCQAATDAGCTGDRCVTPQCDGAACSDASEACVPSCTVGAQQCSDGKLRSCESISGCASWSAPAVCSGGCSSSTSCAAAPSNGIFQVASYGNDQIASIALLSDGRLAIAGFTDGPLGGGFPPASRDVFLTVLNPTTGTRDWTRTWGSANAEFEVGGVFVDKAGALAVVSRLQGMLPDSQVGPGIVVSRYDTAGTLMAHRATQLDVEPKQAVPAANGAMWLAGGEQRVGDGWPDAYTVRLDGAGAVVGESRWGVEQPDIAGAISAAPDDGAYVTGNLNRQLFCSRLSAAGQVVWTKTWAADGDANGRGVAALAGGGALLTGFYSPASGTPSFVRKVDADGNIVWTESAGVAAGDAGQRLVIAPDGTFYLAGITTGEMVAGAYKGMTDVFVQHRDASGKVLWTKQYGSDREDSVTGIALSSSALFVAGNTLGTLGTGTNAGSFDGYVLRIPL